MGRFGVLAVMFARGRGRKGGGRGSGGVLLQRGDPLGVGGVVFFSLYVKGSLNELLGDRRVLSICL